MAKRDRSNTAQLWVPLSVRAKLDKVRDREKRSPRSYPYHRIVEDILMGRINPLGPIRPPDRRSTDPEPN